MTTVETDVLYRELDDLSTVKRELKASRDVLAVYERCMNIIERLTEERHDS